MKDKTAFEQGELDKKKKKDCFEVWGSSLWAKDEPRRSQVWPLQKVAGYICDNHMSYYQGCWIQ